MRAPFALLLPLVLLVLGGIAAAKEPQRSKQNLRAAAKLAVSLSVDHPELRTLIGQAFTASLTDHRHPDDKWDGPPPRDRAVVGRTMKQGDEVVRTFQLNDGVPEHLRTIVWRRRTGTVFDGQKVSVVPVGAGKSPVRTSTRGGDGRFREMAEQSN